MWLMVGRFYPQRAVACWALPGRPVADKLKRTRSIPRAREPMVFRRACVPVLVVLLLCQCAARQRAAPFIRLSRLPTPAILETGVIRQQTVDIPSPTLLSDPERSAVLQLDLFADVSVTAVRQRLDPTLHGISWVGALDGYPDSTALFVRVDDEIMGRIYTPFGVFRVARDRTGVYLAQQVTPTSEGESDAVVPPR